MVLEVVLDFLVFLLVVFLPLCFLVLFVVVVESDLAGEEVSVLVVEDVEESSAAKAAEADMMAMAATVASNLFIVFSLGVTLVLVKCGSRNSPCPLN